MPDLAVDPAVRAAVEGVVFGYADAVDAGDLAAVGRLFAHGKVCAHTPKGPMTLAEGADGVEAFYRSLVRLHHDGTPLTRHITTNLTITPGADARSATARSSYTVFQALEGFPLQAIIIGRYDDMLHEVDGTWGFASRTMASDLTGDLSHHLLR